MAPLFGHHYEAWRCLGYQGRFKRSFRPWLPRRMTDTRALIEACCSTVLGQRITTGCTHLEVDTCDTVFAIVVASAQTGTLETRGVDPEAKASPSLGWISTTVRKGRPLMRFTKSPWRFGTRGFLLSEHDTFDPLAQNPRKVMVFAFGHHRSPPLVQGVSRNDHDFKLIGGVARLRDLKEQGVVVDVQAEIASLVRAEMQGDLSVQHALADPAPEVLARFPSRGRKIAPLAPVENQSAVTFLVRETVKAKCKVDRYVTLIDPKDVCERL